MRAIRRKPLAVLVAAVCLAVMATPASATGHTGFGRITSAEINIGPIEIVIPGADTDHPCDDKLRETIEVEFPKAPVGNGNQNNITVTDLDIVTLFKDPFQPPPTPPAPDNRDWYQLRLELTNPLFAIYNQMGDLNETTGPKPLEIDNLELDLYFEIWSMPNVKDEEAEEPCEKEELICLGFVGFPDLEGGYHPDDYPNDILPGHAWLEGESDEDGVISDDCDQPFTQILDEIVEIKSLEICFKDTPWAPTDPDCSKP